MTDARTPRARSNAVSARVNARAIDDRCSIRVSPKRGGSERFSDAADPDPAGLPTPIAATTVGFEPPGPFWSLPTPPRFTATMTPSYKLAMALQMFSLSAIRIGLAVAVSATAACLTTGDDEGTDEGVADGSGDDMPTGDDTPTGPGTADGSGGGEGGGIPGPENTDAACSDMFDNDDDTFFDCEDFDCENTAPCMGAGTGTGDPENTAELCSDMIDNDGDTFTDCDDFDCIAVLDSCQTPENTVEACSDNVDNDGDTFVDCDDFDCQDAEGVECILENTLELCSDKMDNDGDTFTDCDDFDCSNFPICGGEGATDAECSDMKDNDGDTFTDCDDFGCAMNPDITVCSDK